MKKQLIIIALLTLSSTAFAQVNKYLRQAKRTADFEERIELCNKVIELDPKNLDAFFLRGIAKNDSGDYYGAIVDYSRIIVLEPDADTYYNRGNSRYALNDFLGAKLDYQKAYELDPNFIDALYSLGCTQYILKEHKDAINTFNKVLAVTPYDTRAIYQRADSYNTLKAYTSAFNDYTLAINIDRSAIAYYNRGVFLMSLNYFKEAFNDFDEVLRKDQTNTYAYFFRGTASLFLEKPMQALRDYNSVLKFDALDFDAMIGLSITYYILNDTEQAKIFFKKACNIIDPDHNIKNINQLKNTYWHTNQYDYLNLAFKKLTEL